jgi:FecR-like protein
MNGDYLWDRSGEPDPEIERLENLLGLMGHKPGKIPAWNATGRRWPVAAWAVAASVLVIAGAGWIVWQKKQPAWQVTVVEGAPSITRLARGQSFTTDSGRARLNLNNVGEVQIEPNTTVSVVSIKAREQRLALNHGTIHALIWAPPGQFFVNTPSAQTVDLGCEYTLHVDDSGVGLVHVSVGWVAFESNGRESFIPAAAACHTRPGKGPGVPYYEDAPQTLIDAVNRFDAGDAGAVAAILSDARQRDAITLWHLLRRVAPGDRGRVYDRLAGFVKVPADVSREAVLAGDVKMIDQLWDSLDLGDTSWWRIWKSRTPQ